LYEEEKLGPSYVLLREWKKIFKNIWVLEKNVGGIG